MCDAEKQKWMSRGFTSILSKGGSLEDLTLAVKQILASQLAAKARQLPCSPAEKSTQTPTAINTMLLT